MANVAQPIVTPIIRALDSNGDWLFGGGTADYNIQQQEIEQDAQTAVEMFLGEAFWDTGFGVDWLNLLGSIGAQATLVRQVTQVLSNIKGVLQVVQVTPVLNSTTRQITIKYVLRTVYSLSLTYGTISPSSLAPAN